jgi:O-methyltransferase involved in polyketide biosynthesis
MTGLGQNIVLDDPDVRTPHPARMYDYFLGGKNNFAVDREAAERAMELVPYSREVAWANRQFMTRAVRTMADAGIDQFIDLGSGFPTSPSVHEVARQSQPDARVVYADNDPVVVQHNMALLAKEPHVLSIAADVRCPTCILDRPEVNEVIDLSRPVGVLFIAILHFVTDEEQPGDIVTAFRSRVPAGSMIAISHIRSDETPPEVMERIEDAYRDATAPAVFRNNAEIEKFFIGCDLLEPGVVSLAKWRPEFNTIRVGSTLDFAGGVGLVV